MLVKGLFKGLFKEHFKGQNFPSESGPNFGESVSALLHVFGISYRCLLPDLYVALKCAKLSDRTGDVSALCKALLISFLDVRWRCFTAVCPAQDKCPLRAPGSERHLLGGG